MAGIDADIWVCGDCRSVNKLRAKQCYHCRTPRDVAAVDPTQIEGTGHGKLREIALPEFRSSRWAALLASALLILVAVMQIVSTVSDAILFGRVLRDPGLLADPAFARSVESLVAGTVAVATLGVALLALIAWAFWLSRAVMAMPALGLGYPATNGLMAFIENFLPGLNLFRVPAIVRDVMRRLEPGSLRGEALIFAAWIGLLGGYLVPRFGAYLGLFGTGTLEEIVRETLLVQAIATALVVVGATFLVALIWWIERRIERRRAAQLAGEPAPAASDVVAVPGVVTQGAPSLRDPRLTAQPASATPAPAGPSSAAASVAPIAGEVVAESPGTIASRADAATFASRSVTAATGAASTSPPSEGLEAAQTAAAPTPSTDALPAVAPLAEAPAPPESTQGDKALPPTEVEMSASGDDVPAPPGAPIPAGPRLHLRVESGTKMIATLDGASEAITIEELSAAAVALARADGSAVIETVTTTFEGRSLAEQAFEAFSDARVPTTVEG